MSINWIEEENQRAENLSKSGETTNPKAPRLMVAKEKAPKRTTKGFFIQKLHSKGFDTLVFNQKLINGKKAPELAEEAIELLLSKYGITL